MNLSTVISTGPESVTVSNCHDEGTFSDRRVRLDFGNVSLFIRCEDIPEMRDELLRAMREIWDEVISEENEWIIETAQKYAEDSQ